MWNIFVQKMGWACFEGGPTFKRLQYVCVWYSFGIYAYLWKSPKCPFIFIDRSNCCWKCVVSFKLESTECGPNLLYVKLTGVETTEVEAHMATYSFFCYKSSTAGCIQAVQISITTVVESSHLRTVKAMPINGTYKHSPCHDFSVCAYVV